MSLTKPHAIFTSCHANPYEVNKCVATASLLSGRFKSDYMSRHWDTKNKEGLCLLCPASPAKGDLIHLLALCPALQESRDKLLAYWHTRTASNIQLSSLLCSKLAAAPTIFVQFLLDASSDPIVI